MRKLIFALAFALALAACASTDPGQANMNKLAAVESTYGIAQAGALTYAKLPLCGTPPCSTGSVIAAMQSADKAAVSSITAAHDALKLDPSGAAASALIAAASSGTSALQLLVNANQGSK